MTVTPEGMETMRGLNGPVRGAGDGGYVVAPDVASEAASVAFRASERAAGRGPSIVETIEARCDVVCRRILEEESEERVGLLKRELMGLAFAVVAMRQPFAGMVGPVAASKWAKQRLKEVRTEWLSEE